MKKTVILVLLSHFLAVSSFATTLSVTTPMDEFGEGTEISCSLREAIQAANTDRAFGGCEGGSGADIILLPAGSYALTREGASERNNVSGNLNIEESVEIRGEGDVEIVGNSNSIESGGGVLTVIGGGREIILRNLIVRGGRGINGGGLYVNGARVTLQNVLIRANRAEGYGGGLYNVEGMVVIEEGSRITENNAVCGGGGISNDSPPERTVLTIRGGVLLDNNSISNTINELSCSSEHHDGGGIFNRGRATITESTIRDNRVFWRGGGIYNDAQGHLTLDKSTVSRNSASAVGGGVGGGIVNSDSAQLEIINTTIAFNTAASDGGAIYHSGGQTNILHATIAYNEAVRHLLRGTAGGRGGGIFSSGRGVTIRSSILAHNLGSNDRYEGGPDCFDPIQSLGHNILGNNVGCESFGIPEGERVAGALRDLVGSTRNPLSAGLSGELQNNGGLTQTIALLEESIAINRADRSRCPTTDQRGIARLDCDRGAFEFACGNGALDTSLGESCDDGNRVGGDGCSANCQSNESCGNGIMDVARGEECDAGASNSNEVNSACHLNCRLPRCGDGILDNGESCDDSNSNDEDACHNNCVLATCGDGRLDAGEGCDFGALNSDSACGECRTNCMGRRCGDGIVDRECVVVAGARVRPEACDDGNLSNNDACSNSCRVAFCGDGFVWEGVEICDDRNTVSGDGCSADCLSDETLSIGGGDLGGGGGEEIAEEEGGDAGGGGGVGAPPAAPAEEGGGCHLVVQKETSLPVLTAGLFIMMLVFCGFSTTFRMTTRFSRQLFQGNADN